MVNLQASGMNFNELMKGMGSSILVTNTFMYNRTTHTGFSISCGVDGLNTKVGGGRSECYRQEPLGGSKFQNLEGQKCRFVRFGKQSGNKKNSFQQET